NDKHFTSKDVPVTGASLSFGTFLVGGPATIRQYSRTRTTLLGRDWSVDTSPDNVDSILMWHKTSGMVFTGDSVGWKILSFLKANKAATDAIPTFRLFKLPHHGSLRNSQRTNAQASFNVNAQADYGLHLLLNWGLRKKIAYFPDATVTEDT